jgi:ArsR family transcriptional regulator
MQNALSCLQAGFFQALAHPTRINVVELLREEELSVSQICERLGLEQANVSQHLAVLHATQITSGRKEGNKRFYSLTRL